MFLCDTCHIDLFQKHQIPHTLISTDIIECLFGKIKYIIEKSPTKDFNKSVLLLPAFAGELTEESIIQSQKAIKIKDIKTWEAENIGDTILKQKRKEFDKLKSTKTIPKGAENMQELAA